MVDNVSVQLETLAKRAGLERLFGRLSFHPGDVAALQDHAEGEMAEVPFANEDGPVGVLIVDAYSSGSPDEAGMTLGLRGWRLFDDIASV